MIPGHLREEPPARAPLPRGFGYECTPCDIKGWAEALEASDVRCWSCGEPPTKSHPSSGVHGVVKTNPDVEGGTTDRALWI